MIDYINWPENEKEKINQYLKFAIYVVDQLNVTFPSEFGDPIQMAKGCGWHSISRRL